MRADQTDGASDRSTKRAPSAILTADGMQAGTESTYSRQDPGHSIATLSAVCWLPRAELNPQQWMDCGRRLGRIGAGTNWWIGDWLRYGNARYGDRYKVACKLTGYDAQTLMNFAYVSARIHTSGRREEVSWSHHAALAALDADEQAKWLDRIVTDRLSLKDLRVELRAMRSAGGRASCRGAHARGGDGLPTCPTCGQPLRLGLPLRSVGTQIAGAPEARG
jgi:hypothetical protein